MRKGFTLIEIIVVVAIIAVVIGAAVAAYGTGARKQNFEKDIVTFVDVLNSMRNRTIARDVNGRSCSNGVRYFVDINEAANTFTSKQRCDDSSGVTNHDLVTYAFKNSDFLNVSLPQILFTYPYGYVPPPQIVIDITSTETNQCKTVTISPVGTIDVIDYDC